MQLPIDEIKISKQIGRTIHSPIYVARVSSFEGIETKTFIDFYAPLFTQLSWDYYDVKRRQFEFLTSIFPADREVLFTDFKAYYQNNAATIFSKKYLNKLSAKQLEDFQKIIPWRRRGIAQFEVSAFPNWQIQRQPAPQFSQQTEADDLRALPRVLQELPELYVENELFYALFKGVFHLVKKVRPKMRRLRLTIHFMSVRALIAQPGDNSPEGAHEDGTDYIISALVINRTNLEGGESQIIEKLPTGEKEIILRHTLQPGEFIFQADFRDELVYGTDLWHHVTPFYVANPTVKEGWRDIIGFDIDVVE